MKILYGIQGTGNGHLSRAMTMHPYLSDYADVDYCISGINHQLPFDLPIIRKFKGLNLFYSKTGGLDYWRMMKAFQAGKFFHEIQDVPVKKYDLVISDFEPMSAWAARLKGVPCIHLGHQASFQYPEVPLGKEKDKLGKYILKNFVRAERHIGFHFQAYNTQILPPILSALIFDANPSNANHCTVYLPQMSLAQIVHWCIQSPDIIFHVFSNEIQEYTSLRNVEIHRISKETFHDSMINSELVMTSGGFETPAEAIYLKKKLLVIPIKNHYEQQANGEALRLMGVPVFNNLNEISSSIFQEYYFGDKTISSNYFMSTDKIIRSIFERIDGHLELPAFADKMVK